MMLRNAGEMNFKCVVQIIILPSTLSFSLPSMIETETNNITSCHVHSNKQLRSFFLSVDKYTWLLSDQTYLRSSSHLAIKSTQPNPRT